MGFTDALQNMAPALAVMGAGVVGGPDAAKQSLGFYQAGRQMREQQDAKTALNLMAEHDNPFDAMGAIQAQGLQLPNDMMANLINQRFKLGAQRSAALADFQRQVAMEGLKQRGAQNLEVLKGGIAAQKPRVVTPGSSLMDSTGKVLGSVAPNETWTLKEGIGSDGKPTFFQVNKKGQMRGVPGGYTPIPKTGMTVTTPDGTTVQMGGTPGGAAGLTKSTQNQVQKDLLAQNKSLAQAQAIANSYNPQWQNIWGKLASKYAGAKDFMGWATPEEKAFLEKTTEYRANAYELLNSELNRLSGAAVTEHEMKRLTQSLPNPGSSLTDGDSPVQFTTKLKRAIKSLRMANARLKYVQSLGFRDYKNDFVKRGGTINLDQVPSVISNYSDKVGAELERKYPNMPEAKRLQLLEENVKKTFGLDF